MNEQDASVTREPDPTPTDAPEEGHHPSAAAKGERADAPHDPVDGADADPEAHIEEEARVPAPEKKPPAWKPPPSDRLEGAVEAMLVVSGDVLRLERLRDLLGLASIVPVREAVASIQERWSAAGLAFEVEEVAGGVRVVTRPEFAEYVARLSRKPAADKLSRALLETLCIVAYKQPVGRAEVERIRGVQAGEPLRQLLERRLLKVVGRSDQPGRPLLYGTTQHFLTAFGLMDIKDLPAPKDLQRL